MGPLASHPQNKDRDASPRRDAENVSSPLKVFHTENGDDPAPPLSAVEEMRLLFFPDRDQPQSSLSSFFQAFSPPGYDSPFRGTVHKRDFPLPVLSHLLPLLVLPFPAPLAAVSFLASSWSPAGFPFLMATPAPRSLFPFL